jgi:hypothetical protein
MAAVPARLDHLVYAVPDFTAAVPEIEELLGPALPGGAHPAWGTRNALWPLGPATYLEVIGPDPAKAARGLPTVFGIAELSAPRLVTWAAQGTELARLCQAALLRGIDLGVPARGRRVRPDGTAITWELTDPYRPRADGLVPFFIDWSGSRHPAAGAPPRLELLDVHGQHPHADDVAAQLAALDVDLHVMPGPVPALIATLRTPSGVVVLR